MLIDGLWHDEDRTIRDGAYVRPVAPFAAPIPATLSKKTLTEPGRFHLIASLSCPWSHRTTLLRAIKRLAPVLPLHIAAGPRTQGYRLGTADAPWTIPGTDRTIQHLHALYTQAAPGITARATVPLIWDATERTILSNESARILPALDTIDIGGSGSDWTLVPERLRDEIGALSGVIQTSLCNAVYRAGKARSQAIHDAAVHEVFLALDRLEARLQDQRFLHGPALTETDIRLWPTLARFDLVYHGHFKCALRRLTDYPNLWGYTRDILAWPGVAQTFAPDAIRTAYYGEDLDLNPTGIVATAPDIDWHAPHGRDRLGARHVWRRDGTCMPLGSEHGHVP